MINRRRRDGSSGPAAGRGGPAVGATTSPPPRNLDRGDNASPVEAGTVRDSDSLPAREGT